jgi:hypothetical protein
MVAELNFNLSQSCGLIMLSILKDYGCGVRKERGG